jgi:hypothetical protein
MFPRFASEALALDGVFHIRLMRAVNARADAALIAPCLLPFASLFVLESHDRLQEHLPGFRVDPPTAIEIVRNSRHRTKLLLSKNQDLSELVDTYADIAAKERDYFSSLHAGFFAPLKRLFQPDLGFCAVDGHIFSTTHGTRFIYGMDSHDPERLRELGYTVAAYCTQLIAAFAPTLEVPSFASRPLGRIQQTDIKSLRLYRRGTLGALPEKWAAALTMVLANLNVIRHILTPLVGDECTSIIKLRALQCFNAIHSIRRVQDQLRGEGRLSQEASELLGHAISCPEAKWLRRKDDLRDMLVHFVPRTVQPEHAGLSFADAIAVFGRASSAEVVSRTTDLLTHLTNVLTRGFKLDKNAFWYGRLREEAG